MLGLVLTVQRQPSGFNPQLGPDFPPDEPEELGGVDGPELPDEPEEPSEKTEHESRQRPAPFVCSLLVHSSFEKVSRHSWLHWLSPLGPYSRDTQEQTLPHFVVLPDVVELHAATGSTSATLTAVATRCHEEEVRL